MVAYTIQRFFANRQDQKGITMIEYALMAALVAAVLTLAFSGLTDAISAKFNAIAGMLK